jgi:hypothetical protein
MSPNRRFPSHYVLILIIILMLFLIGVSLAAGNKDANASESLDQGEVNLPLVMKGWPPPTPTPRPAVVRVDNDTGGQLCYEIMDTGIGEKCFPVGVYLYGSFTPGTYNWKATARCGTASGTRNFLAGEWTHQFWCTSGAGLLEKE